MWFLMFLKFFDQAILSRASLIDNFASSGYNSLIKWMSKSQVWEFMDKPKQIHLFLINKKLYLIDGNNYVLRNLEISRYKQGHLSISHLKKSVKLEIQWIIYLMNRYKLKMRFYFDRFFDKKKREPKQDMVFKIRAVSYAKKLLKQANIPIEKVWIDSDRQIRFVSRKLRRLGVEVVVISRDIDFLMRGWQMIKINSQSAAGQRGKCGSVQLTADSIEKSQGSQRVVKLMLLQISKDQRKATTLEILPKIIRDHDLTLGITNIIKIAAENTGLNTFTSSLKKALGSGQITTSLCTKFFLQIEYFNSSLVFTGNGNQKDFYHQPTADQLMTYKGFSSKRLKKDIQTDFNKTYSMEEQRYEGESQDEGEQDQFDPHWLPDKTILRALDCSDSNAPQHEVNVPVQRVEESPQQQQQIQRQLLHLSSLQVPPEWKRECPDDSMTFTKKRPTAIQLSGPPKMTEPSPKSQEVIRWSMKTAPTKHNGRQNFDSIEQSEDY